MNMAKGLHTEGLCWKEKSFQMSAVQHNRSYVNLPTYLPEVHLNLLCPKKANHSPDLS